MPARADHLNDFLFHALKKRKETSNTKNRMTASVSVWPAAERCKKGVEMPKINAAISPDLLPKPSRASRNMKSAASVPKRTGTKFMYSTNVGKKNLKKNLYE